MTTRPVRQRGKTVHGELANAGHRVLAPDDAEVEAYLEVALDAPGAGPPRLRRPRRRRPARRGQRRRAGHRRRPRLREPVRPADRAPRPRAPRLLGAAAARHARTPSWSAGDRAPSSSRAAPARSTTRARRGPIRPSGTVGSPSSASATAPSSWPSSSAATSCRPAHREYGPATMTLTGDDRLFAGLERDQPVWMSHGDSITRLPAGFVATAQTPSTPVRRPGRPRSAGCTGSSSTPRWCTRRAAATCCATSSSASRVRGPPGRRRTSSSRR